MAPPKSGFGKREDKPLPPWMRPESDGVPPPAPRRRWMLSRDQRPVETAPPQRPAARPTEKPARPAAPAVRRPAREEPLDLGPDEHVSRSAPPEIAPRGKREVPPTDPRESRTARPTARPQTLLQRLQAPVRRSEPAPQQHEPATETRRRGASGKLAGRARNEPIAPELAEMERTSLVATDPRYVDSQYADPHYADPHYADPQYDDGVQKHDLDEAAEPAFAGEPASEDTDHVEAAYEPDHEPAYEPAYEAEPHDPQPAEPPEPATHRSRRNPAKYAPAAEPEPIAAPYQPDGETTQDEWTGGGPPAELSPKRSGFSVVFAASILCLAGAAALMLTGNGGAANTVGNAFDGITKMFEPPPLPPCQDGYIRAPDRKCWPIRKRPADTAAVTPAGSATGTIPPSSDAAAQPQQQPSRTPRREKSQ